ncbi:uncharacterized protein LOC131186316 [Ahaetulla prasina]|uniref:uncharacterized protein LOC131186316 n=1 Tax=Ahaetulla prasina TaxID=499056 RepID=UPI00264838D4|nr:uncharacterized protein LOC131186316 [Ahaetulla prasina]
MQGSGAWSPDRTSQLSIMQTGTAPLFRTLSEMEFQDIPSSIPGQAVVVSQGTGTSALQPETSFPRAPVLQLPDSIGLMIQQAVRQELAKSRNKERQSRSTSSASAMFRPHREESSEEGSQSSISGEEDAGEALSEDEGLGPEQPSFVGLFKPQLFRSLLFKALATTGLGSAQAPLTDSQVLPSTSSSLFVEPMVVAEAIPAPKMFVDVVQRQWSYPGSGPLPSATDKKFFNCAPDLENILQVPTVDAPVVALTTTSHVTGPENEALRPEDKRADQSLVKSHQASAWAIRSSMASSFFNRASIMWLRQLQGRLSSSDVRAHQDLNKVIAALEFSADSTLNAARFSAKAIGSTVTSRRLLWLRHWKADTRNKWRLASSAYAGSKLFGASLDPILVETKDKKKVLPSLSRRGELRQQPYFRPSTASSSSFRNQEFGGSRRRRYSPFRGNSQRADQSASAVVPPATSKESAQFIKASGDSSKGGTRFSGLVESTDGSQRLWIQGASEGHHHHRRQSFGMGSPSRSTSSTGQVVSPGNPQWYQLSGAARHPPGSSSFRGSHQGQTCTCPHGQRDGEGAYKQVGWHSFSQTDEGDALPRSLGRIPPTVIEGGTHCGDGQLQGGLPQSSDYRSFRMVVVPSEFPRVIYPIRASPGGLIRLPEQQAGPSVLFKVPFTGGGVSGRPTQQVAPGPPICLSADPTDPKSDKEAPRGEGRIDIGRPLLAQETLVCRPDEPLNPRPVEDPGQPSVSSPGTSVAPRSTMVSPSRVEIERAS